MSAHFDINRKAIAELRVDPNVVAVVEAVTQGWLEEANDTLEEGVGYRSAVHRDRSSRGPYVVGRVWTSSNHAKNSNAKYNTLTRLVGR